eukprot:CAMPEP_0172449426 /NCGR_PEP_ID=MMETSP1065-20121228/8141_1 /TAXON_ID=265537 /ORGANISM="Amphiprora paludosa, Strain CCMP125" /LENGTH=433 /DNA_ID=CAMNT_0013201101 /DNA_START=371 /DNA_END=1672 /DNA_ORIENTATION=-
MDLGGSCSVQIPPQVPLNTSSSDFGALALEFLPQDYDQRKIWDKGIGVGPKIQDHTRRDDFYVTDDDNLLQVEYLNQWLHRPTDIVKPTDCRYPQLQKQVYPNCNNFHELGFEALMRSGGSKLIGNGGIKQVFSVDSGDSSKFVLKEAFLNTNIHYTESLLKTHQMDAVVSAAVVPHPLMVDFYGYCSLSLLNEFMDHGVAQDQIIKDKRCEGNTTMSSDHPLVTASDVSPSKKIAYALEMAESLALLHNNPLGVIIHGDIHMSQWLFSPEGRLKLNDFNKADIMMYSDTKQDYCKVRQGIGPGDWRSPEEYRDDPFDEQIDIFSLGNNFYSILTGLEPFPDLCKPETSAERVRDGERSFLDPRWKSQSYEEGKLFELIQMCWEQDPKNRPKISDIVSFLLSVSDGTTKGQDEPKAELERKPTLGSLGLLGSF